LIIVSSDLSHYLPSAAAHSTDMITLRAIEALDPTIETAQACGAMALNGLTTLAIQKNWNPMALDRSDSSTLARTSNDSVVGYGAIAYYAN